LLLNGEALPRFWLGVKIVSARTPSTLTVDAMLTGFAKSCAGLDTIQADNKNSPSRVEEYCGLGQSGVG